MPEYIHAAEFVFPGHPDKLSDAIADALVQEVLDDLEVGDLRHWRISRARV